MLQRQIERWQRTYFFNVVYAKIQSDLQRTPVLLTEPGLLSLNNHTLITIDEDKVYYASHAENSRPVNLIDDQLFNGGKIKLGFCIPTMSMGGVTRSLLTMMNALDQHYFEWSGIAIRNGYAFDPETARLILEHCPIYSSIDHPQFQGLVTIVGNASQMIVDQSDIVNLWGYTAPVKELNHTDWKRKPMLIVAHGQNEWTRDNIQTSLGYAEESLLVSVSQGGIQTFPEHLRERVAVIYNGVDLNHCKPYLSRDEIRKSWGISSETIAVGYIGRFARGKNVFAAAQAVFASGKNHHAIYIGEGIDQNHVINGVKELCGHRYSFMPRTEDIGSVLSGLDCLISASPSEGGPLSVAEAWIAGCPVVSTPVGFIPELEAKYGPLVERL
ncbi:MAG: glycosyltransferase, partial [Planctomycetaceae bacterium]|nr:glycosyltransferase [Planctomycetaceae bacterium]